MLNEQRSGHLVSNSDEWRRTFCDGAQKICIASSFLLKKNIWMEKVRWALDRECQVMKFTFVEWWAGFIKLIFSLLKEVEFVKVEIKGQHKRDTEEHKSDVTFPWNKWLKGKFKRPKLQFFFSESHLSFLPFWKLMILSKPQLFLREQRKGTNVFLWVPWPRRRIPGICRSFILPEFKGTPTASTALSLAQSSKLSSFSNFDCNGF